MPNRAIQLNVLFVIATALIAAPAHAEELYRVNLSPPDHVGQKFDYRATETEASRTQRERGKEMVVMTNQSSALDFHSLVNVEACDPRGMPSQVKLTVKKLQAPSVNMPAIVEPGTEIVARAVQVETQPSKYRDVFEEVSGVCHPFKQIALRRVITIGGEAESTEQQAFGTDKPLPIGGTWSLDGEPGARLLAKLQIKAEPKHVKGSAQLVRIIRRDEIECLEVHMTVNCDDCPAHVPEGRSINASTARCDLTYFIARGNGRIVEATYHSRIDLELQVKNGGDEYIERSASEVSKQITFGSDYP